MSSLNDSMPVNNVLSEEYKLTTEPVVMDNAVEYEWHEIQSDVIASSQNRTASNWRLQLKNMNAYVNPARAYLELSCRLTDAANVNTGDGVNASIQNHILSLFSRATLRVGGQIVETVNEAHVAKGLIQPLLHYSHDYASSSGTNEMFYPEGPGLGTVKVPYNGDEDRADFNEGHRRRYDRSNNKTFHAWVPLSALFGFCSVDRILTNNQFIVELNKSDTKHHVLTGEAPFTQLVGVEKVSIWMPNVLPKSVVDLSLKSAFADGVVSNYMYPQLQCYTTRQDAGTNNFRVVTSSEKVLYAFVVARSATRTVQASAATTLDEINTLEVRLNGRQYPLQPYVNLKGDTADKARAYSDTLRYMNRNYDFSSGINLSYEKWAKTTIYSFDFTSQPEANMGAPATLELKATTSAGVEWSVCVLSEKRAQIRYDGGSSVVLVN
jgi:hypothetical protein